MDLIYANRSRMDVDILDSYDLDLAFGEDENDFTCTTDIDSHCCSEGYFIYVPDTEYGGMVDSINVDTANSEVTYSGRTWHGILASKVIQPASGHDYAIYSGEANEVLGSILRAVDIDGLFMVSDEDSGIVIRNYSMDRYIDAYKGIRKMLKANDAKLNMKWSDELHKVVIKAVPRMNYADEDELDDSQVDFEVKKNYHPTNHLICLGRGDLKERAVIHLFTDAGGTLQEYATRKNPIQNSHYILDESKKVLRGHEEVTEVYDYSSAEVTTNYVLTTSRPKDWKTNYSSYFTKSGDKFSSINGGNVEYTLQKSQPSDWSTASSKYYRKSDDSDNEFVQVEPTTVYELLTVKPTDWDTEFDSYYDSGYEPVTGIQSEEYVVQTVCPDDWRYGYQNYYRKVNGEYLQVESEEVITMEPLNSKPSDWESNYKSYYQRKAAGGYERITASKSPSWKNGVYYTAVAGDGAPAWSDGNYYTRIGQTTAPEWKANTYYSGEDGNPPVWKKNTFYTANSDTTAPKWIARKYYKPVTDDYAQLVAGGIEYLESVWAKDEARVDLDQTEQVYDVGDVIALHESVTGIETVQEVTKKIIKFQNGDLTITYEVN